ncbi:MAG: hypothetical protein KDA91_18320, partial [Planctomycetaceae bacterium]|nr:hypothetical protein [Planctomycetaceae bacterium]
MRRQSMRFRHLRRLDSSIIQTLENRLLLTVSTLPLSPDNDVIFEGDGAVDTITFSVVDGYLQHNLASAPGFESSRDLDSVTAGEQALLISDLGSLTVQDAGSNDRIFFGGTESFALGTASLNVIAGDITVFSDVDVSTTDGVISLLAAEAILVDSGAAIRTVDGGMQLTANADRSTTDSNVDYFGLHLDGATLSTSGAGSIVLEGSGIHSGNNFSAGIGIEGGTTIESTSQEATAGEIRISGFGADGRQLKHGLISRDAGNSLTSAYGDITVTGVGGFRSDGSGVNYFGIYLAGLDISSTGIGPDAAEINIDGTGGAELTTCYGVWLASANVSLSSVDGDIRITGRGGEAATTSRQSGVLIEDIAYIRSTGTGPDAANISIDGTIGTATEPQTSALAAYGVQLTGASTELSTVDGDISIVGSGGLGGVYRHGVNIAAIVSSTGVGEHAGNISVTGQGGTTADGWGAFIAGSWSTVDGNLDITGAGTSSPQRGGNGVRLRDIDLFASTGVGATAGHISIHGSAANGVGVLLEDSNSLLTTVDGDITLFDTDGSGTLLDGFGGIASTGVGEHAGEIVIASKDVSIQNLGTGISSVDGDILLSSVADESAGSALRLNNFGVIESTGTGPDAATITLVGTARDGSTARYGLTISGSSETPSVIRSVDGNIVMIGTGGDRTDPTNRFSENPGITIANVAIESTGTTADAATISIQGTAGDSGRNGHGVFVQGGSFSSVAGDVSLTGTMSNGRGVALSNVDITSTGSGAAAARFTFSGEVPSVSGNVNVIDSDFLLEAAGASFFGNFASTGSGRFSVGQSGTGSTRVSGNVVSAFGPITLQGETVQAAGIYSTGVGGEAATIQIGDAQTQSVIVDGDVSTVDGSILITNRVNPLNTNNGYISIRQSTIQSTGTGPNAGTITINGRGSRGSSGVSLTNNSSIESVDGDISIVGSGTEGGDGIELVGFAHIRSTGVG